MRINIWHLAAAINAAKAAGFDVDNLLAQVVEVFINHTSAAAIPAQLIQEIADVVTRFGGDPITTGMDVASAAAIPEFTGIVCDWFTDAFNIPKSVRFGSITVVWTVKPPKRVRRARKKKVTRRRKSPTKTKTAPRKKKVKA